MNLNGSAGLKSFDASPAMMGRALRSSFIGFEPGASFSLPKIHPEHVG